MNKTILFSPIGGTDPISNTNGSDGSMLHICRHYKPNIVYLYMSKEILDNHIADNRYIYVLERLAELQNRWINVIEDFDFSDIKSRINTAKSVMNCILVKRPELVEVQSFNDFYNEFRKLIKQIYGTMDSTDQLLLNISSGTPAMKSGLLVLATMGEFKCKNIQVTTPVRKMNEHRHSGYNIKQLWELNDDKKELSELRCVEVECPSLSAIKYEEIMKSLIKEYDYFAALQIAKRDEMRDRTKSYIELLEMANDRLNFNYSEAIKINNYYNMDLFYKGLQEHKIECFEYALILGVKKEKKEYADFIRGLTPLLVSLFEEILKYNCKINIDDYCDIEDKFNRKWSKEKLKGKEIEQILLNTYKGNFKYDFVYSNHIVLLLQKFSKDTALKDTVEKLRKVERNVRNMAAHNMVSVSEDKIKQILGFTTDNIMLYIKKCFNYTGMKIQDKQWYAYDYMNTKIIERIS